jgi:hypothetical protein
MFCDKCGTPLQSGQRFCSRCGKEFAGVTIVGYPPRGRVQEHVRLLGIFWMALSAFDAVEGVVLYVFANTFFAARFHEGPPPGPREFLHPFLTFIAILLVVKAAAGFAAGWGLLQREPWARVLTLVIGFVSLFINIPFGTALGIYTMWVLLPTQSEQEYEAQSRKAAIA